MYLDRKLQRRLLELCAADYPRQSDLGGMLRAFPDEQAQHAYAANIAFLNEHGLVDGGLEVGADGHFSFSYPKITARGLDFLEDDGGLTAILGVVTVKLHADTIRELVLARIESAPQLSAEQKLTLRSRIASMGAEGLKELTKQLVKYGLDHVPDVMQWLESIRLP